MGKRDASRPIPDVTTLGEIIALAISLVVLTLVGWSP